jgi:hypothetical protein
VSANLRLALATQWSWRWYDGQTATWFELWSLPSSWMAYGCARNIALGRVHMQVSVTGCSIRPGRSGSDPIPGAG